MLWKESVHTEARERVEKVENDLDVQYGQLEKQHNEFVNHSHQQISMAQAQIAQLLQLQQQQQQQQKQQRMYLIYLTNY